MRRPQRRSREFDVYTYCFAAALLVFGIWLLGGHHG